MLGLPSIIIGRQMRHSRLTKNALLVAAGLLAFYVSIVHAESHSSGFNVGATVSPVATLTPLAMQREFLISESDVARGLVELPVATYLEIHSNSRNGYLLSFHPALDIFTSVEVLGLESAVRLDAEGGAIAQRWHDRTTTRLSIGYRFYLRPGLLPGFYPVPLQLSVAPLR